LEDRQNLSHRLGLDQTLHQQFQNYISGLIRFDLGQSLTTREAVVTEIVSRLPATIELSVTALLLALAWGLPLGVLAAVRENRLSDWIVNLLVIAGMSLPGAFLGPALVYLFAIQLDWFPVSDRDGLEHLVLPAMSLALPLGAVIARMSRASVIEVLKQDFMRTARAKGAGPIRLYGLHALRNALIPLITIVGLQLGGLLTGTVITETVFDWPGIGTLIYNSIQRRDYPVVQGCILFIACIYVIVSFLTDIGYSLADPKVRLHE
jgi:peptide/nickel transport system permease protein